jgi:hypothetical protein
MNYTIKTRYLNILNVRATILIILRVGKSLLFSKKGKKCPIVSAFPLFCAPDETVNPLIRHPEGMNTKDEGYIILLTFALDSNKRQDSDK